MIKKMIKKLLSEEKISKLKNIRDIYFDSHAKKSYSQEGEDMILRRLFENQESGFYVDVGAHHPQRFSNTYFFYKQGWRGINIDAMPDSMKAFDLLRPNDINIEKPISDKKQMLKYYAFNEPALNGFSEELSQQRDGRGDYHIIFEKNIETATLKEILDIYLPKDKPIYFLSIDVEGLDFKVLKSNDFDQYKPRVILIEILASTLKDIANHEISQYLEKHNYTLYAKAMNTVIFAENNFLKEREGI